MPALPSSIETLFGSDTVGSDPPPWLSSSTIPTPPCLPVDRSDPLSVEVRFTKKPSGPSDAVSPMIGTEIVLVCWPAGMTTLPEVSV